MTPYHVELAPAAAKSFRSLPSSVRPRIQRALGKLGRDAAEPGRRGGKAVKTIHGTDDSFHRLRVGDYRVLYDVLAGDQVVLVLGIVHRADLERWIRGR